jgi:hypothetical protein
MSPVSRPISCRSEATFQAYGWGSEDVRAGHLDAELGQHRVDLVLAAGAQRDQLAAVAGDLPQLADLLRGDPGLGQPAHPQQVGQVAGVQLVVLDPAAAEGLHPQRVRQVHLSAGGRQRVRRPVPAVAGLQHRSRVRARPPDLGGNSSRAVGDPRRVQLPPVFGHPHQDRPAAVQVHAHDLRAVVRFHEGPPIVVDGVDTPSMSPGHLRGARRPRSFMASDPATGSRSLGHGQERHAREVNHDRRRFPGDGRRLGACHRRPFSSA